jgi:hypothetical protein
MLPAFVITLDLIAAQAGLALKIPDFVLKMGRQ